jgi:hypothetical protein
MKNLRILFLGLLCFGIMHEIAARTIKVCNFNTLNNAKYNVVFNYTPNGKTSSLQGGRFKLPAQGTCHMFEIKEQQAVPKLQNLTVCLETEGKVSNMIYNGIPPLLDGVIILKV